MPDNADGSYSTLHHRVEHLLRLTSPVANLQIAEALWAAASSAAALVALDELAAENLVAWSSDVHDRDLDSDRSWSSQG